MHPNNLHYQNVIYDMSRCKWKSSDCYMNCLYLLEFVLEYLFDKYIVSFNMIFNTGISNSFRGIYFYKISILFVSIRKFIQYGHHCKTYFNKGPNVKTNKMFFLKLVLMEPKLNTYNVFIFLMDRKIPRFLPLWDEV